VDLDDEAAPPHVVAAFVLANGSPRIEGSYALEPQAGTPGPPWVYVWVNVLGQPLNVLPRSPSEASNTPVRSAGQATQREATEKFGVDRSTVVHICRIAKQGALDALAASVPGRPGQSAEQAELAAARKEIERLRATVTEQAVTVHLHQANRVGTDRRPGPAPGGRHRQGRSARPGLARRHGGWSARRASAALGLEHTRLLRRQSFSRQRRATQLVTTGVPTPFGVERHGDPAAGGG
jgi:hypothetical protein